MMLCHFVCLYLLKKIQGIPFKKKVLTPNVVRETKRSVINYLKTEIGIKVHYDKPSAAFKGKIT